MSHLVKHTQSRFSPRTLVSAMYYIGLIGITTSLPTANAQPQNYQSPSPKVVSGTNRTAPIALDAGQSAVKNIYNTKVQTKPDSTEILVQFDSFPTKPTINQVMVNGYKKILVDFGLVNFSETNFDNLTTPQLRQYRLYQDSNNHVILEANINQISRFDSVVDKGTFILRLFATQKQQAHVTQQVTSQINDLLINQNNDGVSGVRVTLPNPNTEVNVTKNGNRLAVYFKDAVFNDAISKEVFINSKSALIYAAKSYNTNGIGVIELASSAPFENRINRDGKVLTIDFSRPKETQVKQTNQVVPLKNRNKLVSMDFQDVDTRRILQVLASYTGTNIVASDSIKSTISIKLDQVPWEQALRVILSAANLVQHVDGDIILVSPADELARREADALKLETQNVELVPTETAYLQLNYSVASDIAALIKKTVTKTTDTANTNTALAKEQANINVGNAGSLLSPRGSISVDNRTNTIIVNDTPQKIRLIQDLVKKLDVPVRQVMVEAKIVHANDDFSKALGVRWGVNRTSNPSISADIESLSSRNKPNNGNTGSIPIALDLARSVASMGTSGIAFGLINTSSTLLSLQLAALQSDGRGEVLSAPRVLTGDKQTATIRSGAKVPYQTTSDNNGTTTTFQDAVLELKVTPSITPDGNVQMKLAISKDSLGTLTEAGYVINTNTLDTNVLVGSGETVVLGGFYENAKTSDINKVPVLGDARAVGKLFRSQRNEDRKQELLIFITPQVVEQQGIIK